MRQIGIFYMGDAVPIYFNDEKYARDCENKVVNAHPLSNEELETLFDEYEDVEQYEDENGLHYVLHIAEDIKVDIWGKDKEELGTLLYLVSDMATDEEDEYIQVFD